MVLTDHGCIPTVLMWKCFVTGESCVSLFDLYHMGGVFKLSLFLLNLWGWCGASVSETGGLYWA